MQMRRRGVVCLICLTRTRHRKWTLIHQFPGLFFCNVQKDRDWMERLQSAYLNDPITAAAEIFETGEDNI